MTRRFIHIYDCCRFLRCVARFSIRMTYQTPNKDERQHCHREKPRRALEVCVCDESSRTYSVECGDEKGVGDGGGGGDRNDRKQLTAIDDRTTSGRMIDGCQFILLFAFPMFDRLQLSLSTHLRVSPKHLKGHKV